VRVTAVIAVAVAVAIVLLLLLGGGSNNNQSLPASGKKVAAVSEQGLRTLANTLHGPIYWAGPQQRTTYELTQTANGRIFVRYLPPGVKIGTSQRYPFVATFPFTGAYAGTAAVAARPDSVRIPIPGSAVAFYPRAVPTNAYVAFGGSNYQIEVFDPNPSRMRRLIATGAIQPVSPNAPGAVSGSTVTAATVARLALLPGELGHPVYWAGSQPGVEYELTETNAGNVFVRYLPAGARVGTSVRYLFVATFPLANAFVATARVAARPSSVKLPVPGGGVAFYGVNSPTTAYVAFPGSNYQIEVFDPNAQRVRALVNSGQIRPIR
jgi:hypothetical protein